MVCVLLHMRQFVLLHLFGDFGFAMSSQSTAANSNLNMSFNSSDVTNLLAHDLGLSYVNNRLTVPTLLCPR